ncbi:MAG: hypothetical protein RL385_980 [Pseudomonadota bacterium]
MSVTLRVFDPALCCSTGVCGPSVDPELARFAADVAWLEQQGVKVERYNLSQEPGAFADTPVVKEALARGTEVLPLVLIEGRIVAEGTYPARETLAALSGVVVRKAESAAKGESSCCPPSGESKSKNGCC